MKAMRRIRKEDAEEHFWPSFTDVMSSLVFILFFFIVILFIKQIISAKSWDTQLARVTANLNDKQALLAKAEKDLNAINQELSKKKEEMLSLESSLIDRENRINELKGQLTKDQQVLYLKERELAEVKGKLEEISVLRLSLLKEVKDSIEAELGSAFNTGNEPLVTIDSNANLVIQSSLLFAKGSSEISESGRKMLRKFASAFEKILSSPTVRESIDSIIISGHADSDDTYSNNYFLSCNRAIAVINTMMTENPVLERKYGNFFQASGFSEFRPVALGSDEAAKSKNRRIEISINIRDAHIQEIINAYMQKQP